MRDIELYDEEEFKRDFPEVMEIVEREAQKLDVALEDHYFVQFEGSAPYYMVTYALEEDEDQSLTIELEKKEEWEIIESSYEQD